MTDDYDDESWEDLYEAMGVDPYGWMPGHEAYQAETARIADKFRTAERDELLRAQAYCAVTDRRYDTHDEIWILQVQGNGVEPVAYGPAPEKRKESFIAEDFSDVDSVAEHPVMFFTQHADRDLEPAEIGEYFFGAGYELDEDVPASITRVGEFEHSLLNDRFLGPGLKHLYTPETFHE